MFRCLNAGLVLYRRFYFKLLDLPPKFLRWCSPQKNKKTVQILSLVSAVLQDSDHLLPPSGDRSLRQRITLHIIQHTCCSVIKVAGPRPRCIVDSHEAFCFVNTDSVKSTMMKTRGVKDDSRLWRPLYSCVVIRHTRLPNTHWLTHCATCAHRDNVNLRWDQQFLLKSTPHVLCYEMSQTGQTTASDLTEGYPVTTLTVVVLLLIPCVVILLLLNCLFLGYKLLVLSKRRRLKREDAEELLLQSTLHRVRRLSDVAFPPLQDGRRAYMSLSEPVLPHPVTSSRASSRERAGVDHGFRLLRPDGATGSGSLRAPSTIRATSPAARFSPRLDLASGSRTYGVSKALGWCQSAPVLPQSSDSEAEIRVNLVPPNSPAVSGNHCWLTGQCSGACWLNYGY